jgi:hypothetical protein
MHGEVGLAVAFKIELACRDRSGYRRFEYSSLNLLTVDAYHARHCDVDGYDLHSTFMIIEF